MMSLLISKLCVSFIISFIPSRFAFEMNEEFALNQTAFSLHRNEYKKFGAVKFFILPNEEHAKYFRIDETTGTVSVQKRVDRETLCPESRICDLRFSVNVLLEGSVKDSLDVKVTLKDINDQGCNFVPTSTQSIRLPEDSMKGTRLPLHSPRDLDVFHSIKLAKIRLLNDSLTDALFSLNIINTSSRITPFQLELQLLGSLDYESQKWHYLIVQASDGVTSHACFLYINITVVDVDDNDPRFHQSIYEVNIPEDNDTYFYIPIVNISATDADGGEHGRVEYEIRSIADAKVHSTFRVDPHSGSVYLKQKLLYEVCSRYEIPLQARNPHPSSRFGISTLIVNVKDVNNHPPLISVSSPMGQSKLRVVENARTEVDVAFVNVKDIDSEENGRVTCWMDWCQVANSLELRNMSQQGKYRIVALRGFDRETVPQVQFKISCKDFGTPTQVNSFTSTLHIIDENDNAPEFSKPEYSIAVYEDSHPRRDSEGFFLLKLSATDKDEGQNANISYRFPSLPSHIRGLLTLDTTSGIVRSNGQLDREKLACFQFHVLATDNGTPETQNATVRVNVTLLDFNDHTPSCDLPSQGRISIEENTMPHTLIGEFLVEDDDIGLNGQIAIQLDSAFMSGNQYPAVSLHSHFNVSLSKRRSVSSELSHIPQSLLNYQQHLARIYIKQHLDRERYTSSQGMPYEIDDPVITLVFLINDKGDPSLSTTCQIEVQLLDVNDNTPQIQPIGNNSQIYVSRMEPEGYEFAQVHATDSDAGTNGTVTYKILSGNEKEYFSIDPITGHLRLARLLPYDALGDYQLYIEASDGGNPPLRNETALYVHVDRSIPKSSLLESLNTELEANINLYIIVTIVLASFIISLTLLTAICAILRKSKNMGSPSCSGHLGTQLDEGLTKGNAEIMLARPGNTSGGGGAPCGEYIPMAFTHFTLERGECLPLTLHSNYASTTSSSKPNQTMAANVAAAAYYGNPSGPPPPTPSQQHPHDNNSMLLDDLYSYQRAPSYDCLVMNYHPHSSATMQPSIHEAPLPFFPMGEDANVHGLGGYSNVFNQMKHSTQHYGRNMNSTCEDVDSGKGDSLDAKAGSSVNTSRMVNSPYGMASFTIKSFSPDTVVSGASPPLCQATTSSSSHRPGNEKSTSQPSSTLITYDARNGNHTKQQTHVSPIYFPDVLSTDFVNGSNKITKLSNKDDSFV